MNMLNQSEDIKELVIALAKAQSKMEPAKFNRTNPHFKSKYADFTSIMDACRHPLADNGLAIMQYCETINDKLMLVTLLAHVSGQWIKSYFPLNPATMTSQAIGSSMTYAKRYSLSAMLGIVSDEEDDDGETSQGRGHAKPMEVPKPIKKISNQQVASIKILESKLDDECKGKLYGWLFTSYKINKIEDLNDEFFAVVLGGFERAAKSMEQKKPELINA